MQTEKNNRLVGVSSEQLAREIAGVLIEKKGINVTLYDLRGTGAITDFYVNVTGRSATQVASLADDVDYRIGLGGRSPERIEGRRGNAWILVDYIDVIVNIFDKESRDFYNFERLMPEGSAQDISDIVAQIDEKFKV